MRQTLGAVFFAVVIFMSYFASLHFFYFRGVDSKPLARQEIGRSVDLSEAGVVRLPARRSELKNRKNIPKN